MHEKSSATLARELFLSEYQAVLSTISVEVAGYPFGSVVPYCVNRQACPVILISDIAQHTKNIKADKRVSLITLERQADDQQAAGRVTIVGDAEKLDQEEQDAMTRYYTFFPHSRDYHKTHGFNFYLIKPKRIRFIGGFGRIHWLEPQSFLSTNLFSLEEERRILEHMNQDHAEAIRHYCELKHIPLAGLDRPVMVGIDGEGFNIKLDKVIHRIAFPDTIKNTAEARQELVKMAKQPA